MESRRSWPQTFREGRTGAREERDARCTRHHGWNCQGFSIGDQTGCLEDMSSGLSVGQPAESLWLWGFCALCVPGHCTDSPEKQDRFPLCQSASREQVCQGQGTDR